MFLVNGRENHGRSFAKAVSWQALASLDTFLLSPFFTGKLSAARAIASTEILTKVVLHYFHERIWSHFGWSLPQPEMPITANGKVTQNG